MSATRLSFGSQYKFPLKLYEIANDGLIIKWTNDGTGLLVEENEFEQNVMLLYPGFVQVETFHNLRRLFRDYNFLFRVLRKRKPYGAKVEFRHPYFNRDSPALIFRVKKMNRFWPSLSPTATSSPKRIYRSNKLPPFANELLNSDVSESSGQEGFHDLSLNCLDCSDCDGCSSTYAVSSKHVPTLIFDDLRSGNRVIQSHTTIASKPIKGTNDAALLKSLKTTASQSQSSGVTKPAVCQNDPEIFKLLQIYAKNELTESEFWEVVTKRCGRDFKGNSWEDVMDFFDSIVNHDLSPLHHKGNFYELPLSDM
ncbi:IPF1 [Biomphalaria glabrata]|nr:IPF1 [Biomphalaria glabrata]